MTNSVEEFGRASSDDASPLGDASRVLFSGLPATTEARLDAVAQLRASGRLVARQLAAHSYLMGDDRSRTVAQLFFIDETDERGPQWEVLRAGYAGKAIAVATAILLSGPDLSGREADVALRVGFGLDSENTALRHGLLGSWGHHVDLTLFRPRLPLLEIDFEEVFRRTCLAGVVHALGGFGRAADAVPRESATAVIESIRPSRGCAGDWVDIVGHGFGDPQPAGVTLHFTAYNGGLAIAPVDPGNWHDTRIRVRAPSGVGNGPVGFVRETGATGSGQTVAGAAEQLAGEALACLGRPAFGFAQTLRDLGPRLDAPHVGATEANRFAGGPRRSSVSRATARSG